MKKTAAVISALMLTFTLAACSSNYVMQTNDGRTIVAKGKPALDNDTGMISYKDANGVEQQINRSDVKEMVENDQ
ncbi:YgdI/YgdR family lipoprotein [Serratia proteamaculans]|uniref:YgdI/YgdR family lipoprotein n=1 Tax=Serratia proteamaculans TaxID=28151 RepID=UPI0015758DC1|nr:YgdI/YgdR family lipoprotein [Serratia proteamaculans]NTX81769.1 YgdI/YgdR family lipoprotein [Serratia proteamaculans]NTZ30893.1 YgdI/YgdR family lipoprotein [Serratia proteamaculans]